MNKQREAFEMFLKKENLFQSIDRGFNKDNNSYRYCAIQMCWLAWQASLIPDGYMVVPKKPSFTTMQRMNESLINNSDETAKYRMQQIYKAMIEAVEKNDE